MKSVERRVCNRFNVPGASVTWTQPSRLPFVSATAEPGCLVMDMSRGGVRFLASRPLKPGAYLELEIDVPDGKSPIRVSGRVVWSWLRPARSYEVGVEFEPYGDVARANHPEALRRMVGLESRFACLGDGLPERASITPALLGPPTESVPPRWLGRA